MYRINFDPEQATFVIQIIQWGFLWVTVATDKEFRTFDEARSHVNAIGLDKLYQDRSENVRQQYLHSI